MDRLVVHHSDVTPPLLTGGSSLATKRYSASRIFMPYNALFVMLSIVVDIKLQGYN